MMWILILLACGTEASAPTPEGLAQIANEIAASPAKADAVLSTHGVSRDDFEQALFDVAADDAKTRAYLGARK